MEGGYKTALVERAREIMDEFPASNDPAELGGALLDLLLNKAELFSNLIDWRAAKIPEGIRNRRPGLIEREAGLLAMADNAEDGIMRFVENLWEAFREDLTSAPYAESRMIPTMLRGLVDPDGTIGIRSSPTNQAMKALTGQPAFSWAPLQREELKAVNALARELFRIMKDEWNWGPRDLWDVQGFIWETCREPLDTIAQTKAADLEVEPMPATEIPDPSNLILYGPPGTGKTYATAQEAVRLCDGALPEGRDKLMARYRELQASGKIAFITFHQSMNYEDFVEGLRPVPIKRQDSEESLGFELRPTPGIFRDMFERASQIHEKAPASVQQFVLIIDEINRANVSKVFGELITLLEPDKRLGMTNALTVTLPYSRREFGVPANLHIIGTMNTADRSIARLDTALRRRFTFRELAPDVTVPAFQEAERATGIALGKVLTAINERIEYLLDREHRIGHAFFIGCTTRKDVDGVMREKIIPLLQEFFFEDWGMIAAVLGTGFVEGRPLRAPRGLEKLQSFTMSEARTRWRVRDDFAENAYTTLIAGRVEVSGEGPADEFDEEA